MEVICEDAYHMGIKYLTFYAFSTENWNRPPEEVKALMSLLDNYLKTCLKTAEKNHIRVRVIGDISALEESMQQRIRRLEEASATYDGLNLQIAINYGSRDEITRAVRRLCRDVSEEKVSVREITEERLASYLDTADIPDPDLLIRTSGEQRLSNFLLWQSAYTEFYFAEVPWPDFDKAQLQKAVEAYEQRDRRYGKV